MRTKLRSSPSHTHVGCLAALLASVVLLAFPAAGTADEHKSPRPDLVVKGFRFLPDPGCRGLGGCSQFPLVLLEANGTGKFGLDFTVKNVGGGSAGPSVLRVVTNGSNFDNVDVRRLPAGGHVDLKNLYDEVKEPGIYKTFVCADFHDTVNESREGNNCSDTVKIRVVPRRWDVHTFNLHDAMDNGAVYDTGAVDMSFEYHGLENPGTVPGPAFTWFADGTVDEVLSGQSPSGSTEDCTYYGNGSVFHARWGVEQPTGFLSISTGLNKYGAQVRDESASYTGRTSCTGYPTDIYYPVIAGLQTFSSSGGTARGMSPSARSLSGSYVRPLDSPAYTWLLKADIP